MAIATSVSPPGRGGLPGRDLQPTLWHSRVHFYLFFVISSPKSCVFFFCFLSPSPSLCRLLVLGWPLLLSPYSLSL